MADYVCVLVCVQGQTEAPRGQPAQTESLFTDTQMKGGS